MTKLAHIENNTVTGVYEYLPDNWRNISNFNALADDTEYLRSLGWRTIVKANPSYDENTQYLSDAEYEIQGDDVIEIINVITRQINSPPPAVEIDTRDGVLHINAMQLLRTKRDMLLQQTDFTQLSDIIKKNGETLTSAYESYRQTLRDLPDIYSDNLDFVDESTVTYPALPESQ